MTGLFPRGNPYDNAKAESLNEGYADSAPILMHRETDQ
jgi:hypothetical protein